MRQFKNLLAATAIAICCIAIPQLFLAGLVHSAAPEPLRGSDDSALSTATSSPSVSRAPDHLVRQTLPCEANSLADSAWVSFACGRLKVHNYGSIFDDEVYDFEWTCPLDLGGDPGFSGSVILAADSNESGATFRSSLYGFPMFVPNHAPLAGECGFDVWNGIKLGAKRTGGCPGTPTSVVGDVVVSSYSDTLVGYPEFPDAAGVDVIQTVVSTSVEEYGDFVLFRWEFVNRDDRPKGPWHAGSFVDWDVASIENVGRYSEACNGYFMWDPDSPVFAFGMLDPEQPARYGSSDPTVFPAYRIWIYDIEGCLAFETGCLGLPWASPQSWWTTVRMFPLRSNDGPLEGDKGGLLVNPPISLAPLGSAAIHQALYYVDASSNDPSIIEANAVELAYRAARWAGFARGDVNDDGLVDLADVCWLHAGLPIYPDEYSGDVNTDGNVDAADVTYLMNFVSGNGPGPMGEWRFEVPPVAR